MDTITIGNDAYRVGFAKLARSYRKEYKYKVTTEDGVTHSELRGVYVDFSLSLGNVSAAEYDRLMSALLASPGVVTITMPGDSTGETKTYTGEFSGISDEVIAEDDTETLWDNLTLSFTATVPEGSVL